MFKSRLTLTLVRLLALAMLPLVGGAPLARAATLCISNITDINPLIPQANMNGIVYFKGKYAAIATNGVALYSVDGANWTEVPLLAGTTLNALAANDTEIIAVGSGSNFVSTDGINWSPSTTPSAEPLNDIIWTGSEWVAVGDNNTAVTSPDGETWTTQIPGFGTNNVQGIAYTGFTFVAVGQGGTISTSPDGVNWLTHSSGLSGTGVTLNGVAYDPTPGNQILVAVGTGSTVTTSIDQGTTWIKVNGAIAGNIARVRWFDSLGLFIAVGSNERVMTSPDGINWTAGTVITDPLVTATLYGFQDVAVNPAGTHAVIVGAFSMIFNSSDFVNWTQKYEGVYGNLNTMISDSQFGFVEMGGGQSVFSSDGGARFGINDVPEVWTNNGNANVPTPFNATTVIYNPTASTYVAVGNDFSVETSTDTGLNFAITLTFDDNHTPEPTINNVIWTGSEYVAVANTGAGGVAITGTATVNNIEVSQNAKNWIASGIGAAPVDMNGVATNGNGRVVTAGALGEVAVTSDIGDDFAGGAAKAVWVGQELGGEPTFSSVAYGNGLWVVVGAGGAAFTAPDVTNPSGTLTWTQSGMAGATEDLNSVVFINGVFYVFGAEGDIFLSLDTVSWLPCVGPDATGLKIGVGSLQGLAILGGSSNTFVGQPPPSPVPQVRITKQPNDTAAVSGKSFSLSALGVSEEPGNPPIFYPVFYQWLLNGVDLVNGGNVHNSNEATLTINPANASSAGNYTVLVSNGLRSVLSRKAKVTLFFPPVITVQPIGQKVLAASSMRLTVDATGSPTLRYQWYWKGAPLENSAVIQGAKSKTLRILVTQPKRSGAYYCVVTSPYGKATSKVVTVKMG